MRSFFYKNTLGYICSLLLFLIVVVAIHSNGYSFDFTIKTPSYLYTQWTFSYDYGFIKRALPGEIFQYLNVDPNYKNVRIVSIILFLVLFSLFSKLVYDFLKKVGFDNKYIVIYSLCILSLSYTTTQWIREISRFDHIGQILFIFLVILLSKNINRYYILFIILCVLPLMALTHEAMIIFFTPAIIYIHYVQYNKLKDTLIIAFEAVFLLLIIILYGKMTQSQATLIIETFYNYKNFQPYAVSTSLLSLKENIDSNFITFFETKAYVRIFFSILFLSPVFLFVRACTNRKIFVAILFFSAAPLSLSIIAFDYIRWVALFTFNVSVIFLFLTITGKLDLKLIYGVFDKVKSKLLLYSVVSLIVGPIGITSVFSNLHDANNSWEKRELWDQKILVKLNDPIPLSKIQMTISDNNLINQISFLEENDLGENLIKEYIEESNSGNVEAKNTLGFIYFYGIQRPINYCLSFKLFDEAAKLNNANALYNLSFLYRNGVCVDKDINKANQLLVKASNYNNDTAKFMLAYSYLHGENGFVKDINKAQELLIILKNKKNILSETLLNYINEY